MKNGKWIVFLSLLLIAAAFRLAVAHWLPNDTPDDGRVYAQMARNVLEQHVYSHETQAPYVPSLIRLPGYPLFLAGIYSIFGHANNGAVRIAQALLDTATCGLVALLAYYWQPDEKKKRATALAALALAAICPFTTIYAATILTEVPTNVLVMAMMLAATLALRKGITTEGETEKKRFRQAVFWWSVTGLLGGLAVLFRPDNGLFVAAVGFTLLAATVWKAVSKRTSFGVPPSGGGTHEVKPPKDGTPNVRFVTRALLAGTIFSLTFVLTLVPWTIRNWRVFHIFQPLAPAHAEMPGEFVPRGYTLWLRTWLDDDSYVAPFLWSLDTDPIDVDDLPPYAFDSSEEKKRVATLLEAYNNGSDSQAETGPQPPPSELNANPSPQPSPASASGAAKASPSNSPQPRKDSNAKRNSDKTDKPTDETDAGEEDDSGETENSAEEKGVEMTPEIDAGFERLARERIARRPFQFYVSLPIKRVRTMWFDTHSQYWPFEGALLPFEDLDYEHHQQIWLPLFAALTAVYTLLGLGGVWVLWDSGKFEARQWVVLVLLAIAFRLVLFSALENPEPRYLVEFFPFLSVLGGIFLSQIPSVIPKRQSAQAKS